MLARAKNLGLVSLIAALIWLWAEAESLRSTSVTARIAFARVPESLVRIAESPSRDVINARISLEGSTVGIAQAVRALAEQVTLTPGDGGVPAVPGGLVNLQEALQRSPAIAEAGVTVVSVEPATVTIAVVKLVTRELAVQADLSGVDSDGDATVSPPTVRVTVPEAEGKRLPEGASASAVIGVGDLAAVDGPQTVTARVRLPATLAELAARDPELVTLQRDSVRITLRVRKRVESMEVPSVPVWITLPPTEGKSWDVEVVEPFLRNITVSGPTELIQRLRKQELKVIAFVVLSSDELAAGIKSKPAVFAPVSADLIGAAPPAHGPDGTAAPPAASGGLAESAMMEQVAPLKFSAADRRVELRIRRRGDVAAPPRSGGP